jgi:hypothetical protein
MTPEHFMECYVRPWLREAFARDDAWWALRVGEKVLSNRDERG